MTQKGEHGTANLLRARHLWKKATTPGLPRAMAIFLFAVLLFVLGGTAIVATATTTTVVPGVRVMHLDLGGLAPEDAATRIRDAAEQLTITYADREERMTLSPVGTLATYDVDAMVARAMLVGQHSNPLIAFGQRVQARVFTTNISPAFRLNEDLLVATIAERFDVLVKPARNASLRISVDDSGSHMVSIDPESDGTVLNRTELVMAAETALNTLQPTEAPVTVMKDEPSLRTPDVEPLREDVAALLTNLPIRVTAGSDNWSIDTDVAAEWIIAVSSDGGATLSIDAEALRAYLQPRADLIAKKPINAVFEEKDGRVTTFIPSQDGTKLDMDAAIERIAEAIMAGSEEVVDLPVITDLAEVQTGSTNSYGIREIIGVGESNFRGSPRNRRINIDVGRKSLDGILVHPGEEFSLLKALGPIDGAHGYLEELVIKGHETIPEFGGGLCQIGTTTFRAVLDSGLPVTARRNHSYRVSYYELDGVGNYMGPGKDATIYDPAPDFKFKNDMRTSVMLRTYLIGTDRLVFEFWGTDDGRIAEQTDTVILSTTPPPPKKVIKTTTIPPGTTRCTEKPHAGATTQFFYTVTHPSGDKVEEKFMSYYKPWGEVCLLGVTQEELDAENAPTPSDEEAAIVSADTAGATGDAP